MDKAGKGKIELLSGKNKCPDIGRYWDILFLGQEVTRDADNRGFTRIIARQKKPQHLSILGIFNLEA
tara:strand:+ start:317 stop:517 length:201 start_codon:yes stop_codon:yes gene_type:complete